MVPSFANSQPKAKGFWKSAEHGHSKELRDFLEVQIKESRLTQSQRRQLQDFVKKGDALPLRLPKYDPYLPTLKKPGRASTSTASSATRCTTGLRPRQAIILSGAYERPRFDMRSQVTDSLKEKERLQNLMAFGQETSPSREDLSRHGTKKEDAAPKRHQLNNSSVQDLLDQITGEIDERQAFLHEMTDLGLSAKYRSIINTEISQRLRELKLLGKKPTSSTAAAVKSTRRSRYFLDQNIK